jgi:transposase
LRNATKGGTSMDDVSIIGLDLAKNVFQAHGALSDGTVAFRVKISRAKLITFFSSMPRCMVAMEACGAAHHWAREIGALGHEVRLIAPIYVKPFVKRNKNDAADAEAIADAASRSTMRFVAVKSMEKQASGMAFKTRDLFVRQRTQAINALRGNMAEYGVVAPNGPVHVARLAEAVNGSDDRLPAVVIGLCKMLLTHIGSLGEQIGHLEKELRERARQDETARRLMTIPGIGVICATALQALAPAAESFARGRDFAAWLGLTPRQKSSGGKTRLGATTKMGQRDLRRLLICGAVAVVRWALRKGAPDGSWLARMMARKPPLVTAVALTNRTARIAWALMARGGVYRIPSEVAA